MRAKSALVIAIAGDVETMLMDTSSLEEMNPYQFFQAASLYTARLVNPAQAQALIGTAIRTSILEKGPTVLSIPGDIAAAEAVGEPVHISIPAAPVFRPSDSDLSRLTDMINEAGTVAIFRGDGCRDAREEVIELAGRLKAPVGYALRG
jgi:pyruvate dehydrogenase (quinone)